LTTEERCDYSPGVDPVARSAHRNDGHTATRLTRRAANAVALAVVVFLALFVFSAELPSVRAHSPWAEDPYDVVISFAALLVPLVAVLTFVRCQRWRGLAPMPAPALRQVRRGAPGDQCRSRLHAVWPVPAPDPLRTPGKQRCGHALARTRVASETLSRSSNLRLRDIIHLILRCQDVGVFWKE
jgi:hypothetical protein